MSFEKKRKRKKNIHTVEPYSEQDWIARQDAEALARADAVKADPDRMARAKEWAAKQLDESKAKKAEAEKLIELGTG